MQMSNEKMREHIISELQSLNQKKRINRDGANVLCPFHNDSNPSGSINLDVTAKKAPLGWFRCWSCQTSKPWNDYAQAVGLKGWKAGPKKSSDDYLDPKKYAAELLQDDEDEVSIQKELEQLEFFDFQTDVWREIPTSVLEKLGCKFAYYDYTGDFYVWMPVKVFGELRGFVKAEMEKPTDDRPSYVNSKGGWSNQYGLLFFDYAIRMMKKKGLKTIVLCEGPRDVIRLLRAGIPAMAVLGAINWSEDKRFLLEKAGSVENLILMMDGDDAGIKATKRIFKDVKTHFNTKYVKLWKHRVPRLNKKGEQMYKENKNGTKRLLWDNELDPFTAPKEIINKVKASLE
jgi:5S rRNA maturation endonuclease (ribonuclease M5)